MRCSGHVPLGGGPEDAPGHSGETMSPDWSGNTLDFPPRRVGRSSSGKGSLLNGPAVENAWMDFYIADFPLLRLGRET